MYQACAPFLCWQATATPREDAGFHICEWIKGQASTANSQLRTLGNRFAEVNTKVPAVANRGADLIISEGMNTIRIALDWTANTNHSEFFMTLETGMYKDVGLDVCLLSPADDGYALTPAKKVEQGLADLAIAPMETVISYRTQPQPFKMVATATLLQ